MADKKKLKLNKNYQIDFSKVSTVEQVIMILKAFNVTFHIGEDSRNQQDAIDAGLLKEVK